MAKQLVNPIERHVEKLVLGIAGLLLIGVLMKFVFTSPNKVALGGAEVTPGSIDAHLGQKAKEVLARMRNAPAQAESHEPKFEEFARQLSPVKGLELPLASVFAPEIPMVDDPDVIKGRAQLVAIPAPPKPVYTMGRNTLIQGDKRIPVDWVHLAIPFDVKGVSELQRKAWGATLSDVIFATPEVERRMRRADGRWSDEDWRKVECSPAFKMPPAPSVRLEQTSGGVVANKADLKAVEDYLKDLQDPRNQIGILRPMPPNFSRDETPWKPPLISGYDALVMQDQEFLTPNNPTAPVEDRYGASVSDAGKARPEPKSPAQLLSHELDDARAQLEKARQIWSKNDAVLAYNRALAVSEDKEAGADLKTKAQRMMREAELLIVDIERNPTPRRTTGPTTTEVKVRPKSDVQTVWAIDAAPDSIVNGETYQYRMRPRVMNRLAGVPESFSNPLDAQVLIVAGEWSQPTDPIFVPPDSLFFVTRDDRSRREIYVEFFRWYDGVWVKSKAANFGEGQELTFEERVPVPKIGNPSEAETPMVYFGEDLTLLDIEFSRPLRERKSGTTREGVRFASQAEPTTAAVFVDKQGRLRERVVTVDKEDPTKKSIKIYTPTRRASVP